MDTPTQRSATSSGIHYNTLPVQVGNSVHDGDEFVLLTRNRQNQDFKVWSSGDPQQTQQLYTQAQSIIAQREKTAV